VTDRAGYSAARARELFAKANQAILEAHWLRREGRLLRFEASVRASELGETILGVHAESNRSREAEGLQ
jgi:cellobiose-specific phosphotransferase system component IIA